MIYCRFPFVYHQHPLLKQKQQQQQQQKQQKQPQLQKQQIIFLKQQKQQQAQNLKQQQQENGWRKSYNIKCWWYKVSNQISVFLHSFIHISYNQNKQINSHT